MRQMAKDIATYIEMFVDESMSSLNPYILQGKLNNEYIAGNQNKKINVRKLNIEPKQILIISLYFDTLAFLAILSISINNLLRCILVL